MGVWWVGLETACAECGWRHARRGRGEELPNILIRRTEPVVEYICKHFGQPDNDPDCCCGGEQLGDRTLRHVFCCGELGARMASVVVRFSPSLLSSRRTCAGEGRAH